MMMQPPYVPDDDTDWDGDADPGEVNDALDQLALRVVAVEEPIRCRVYRTADQSIPHSTWTSLLFTHEDYDTDSMHSTVSNTDRITFNTAGLYLVVAYTVMETVNNSNIDSLRILLNGSYPMAGINFFLTTSYSTMQATIAVIHPFSASDYIVSQVFQYHGAGPPLAPIRRGSTRLGIES